MRSTILLRAHMTIALLSAPALLLAADPAQGPYHVASVQTDEFFWDGTLTGAKDTPVWPQLDLKAFRMTGSGTDLCIEGSHHFSDYGGTDFSICRSGKSEGASSIFRIIGYDVFPIRPRGALPVLKLGGPDRDSMFFTVSSVKDTIILSTFWIVGGDAGSFFVPGDWPVASVGKLCSLYVAKDPKFASWTPQEWHMYLERMTISRHTLKLIPGIATGVAGGSMKRAKRPPAVAGAEGNEAGEADALGRDLSTVPARFRIGLRHVPR